MKTQLALMIAVGLTCFFNVGYAADSNTGQAPWTATTVEAANNETAKDFLKKGKPASITGEIVDVSCYLQLGKRGEKHIDCGSKCVLNGQPAGILDDKGILTLLIVEEHHPRRDGKVSLKEKFAGLMGQTISVWGILTETNGNRALFVAAE